MSKTAYQIIATHKPTGEQYVLGFHDEKNRDDALALIQERGLSEFLKGYGGFSEAHEIGVLTDTVFLWKHFF